MQQGTLFIISAPSGAGKTSLVQGVIDSLDNVTVSISHTTRAPRPGEENGINYHFVDKAEFERMVADNIFLEYADVFGYSYGTAKTWVQTQLDAGQDVILEIDWQGAALARKKMPKAVSLFIIPPSMEALKERLEKRKQDSEAVIAKRLEEARTEIAHYTDFDYLVVNQDFAAALADIRAIIKANRLKQQNQASALSVVLSKLLNK